MYDVLLWQQLYDQLFLGAAMDDTEFNDGVKIYIKQLEDYPNETVNSTKWQRFFMEVSDVMTQAEHEAVDVARRNAARQVMTLRAMKILTEGEPVEKASALLTANQITNASLKILEDQLTLSHKLNTYGDAISYTGGGSVRYGSGGAL
jgi:hypothetical protein